MTVTEIANNAFLGMAHPSEITIPESVTSIGKYAFGYCFYSHYYREFHELPDNINSNILAYELKDADDSEEFLVYIGLSSDNNDEYADFIKTTYLADCDDFEYNADSETIYVTATKAQILSMADEDSLYINLIYDREYKIVDELYYMMDHVSDDELIPITIYIYAENEKEAKQMRSDILSKYFDDDTECFYDYYSCFYVEATKAQIEALKNYENIEMIDLGDTYCIDSTLYSAIYFAEDSDTFDIYFPTLYSDDGFDIKSFYIEKHDQYFSNCEAEFFYSHYESDYIYVIYGASKEQIINAGYDNAVPMMLFEEPSINKYYNLTIYGATGSAAEEYAMANDITFAEIQSEYQLGDVNLDGKISIMDATLIMKANVNLETLTAQQQELADYDGNGIVNVMDATAIQKMLVM